jgi:hypothetical protein
LDAWRRSELEGKGAELVGKESSVPAAETTAARASDRAGCADSERLAQPAQSMPEGAKLTQVSGNSMVLVIALNNLLEPFTHLR